MHVATSIDTDQITVSHAARVLALSEGMVRVLANTGALPCTRIGSGLRLFRLADVLRVRDERVMGATR